MEKKGNQTFKNISRLFKKVNEHRTGAYAAQAAYFFILSMIPIIMILIAVVQYTPLTEEIIVNALTTIFPSSVRTWIESIVNQIYQNSRGVLSISILVTLWSAGKGVLSVSSGLNSIYGIHETRNYVYLRARASLYTVLFILAIVLSLLISVFGNFIGNILIKYIPMLEQIVNIVIRSRTLVIFIILVLMWVLVYKFLPNRKDLSFRKQLPGAVFTAVGWLLISYIFSVYLDVFTGFTSMYGSLTTIILIMLWLYVCMYVVLLGAELNSFIGHYDDSPAEVPETEQEDENQP